MQTKRRGSLAHDDRDDTYSAKRRRLAHDAATRLSNRFGAISSLSDELLVRIFSYMDENSLLDVSLVSHRFHSISSDSSLWRPHYYRRFILPRAHRIPGFKTSNSASQTSSKLYYSTQRTIWNEAAARRRGFSDGTRTSSTTSGTHDAGMEDRVDWKKQYKLRHNWARGRCAVAEVRVHDIEREPLRASQTLVKVVEGLAVTADSEFGLRAWDLRTRKTIAQIKLVTDESVQIQPSCLAVDDNQLAAGHLDIAVGFHDGTFGIWRLNIGQKEMNLQYIHSKSFLGKLVSIAFGYPYVLTATQLGFISLYMFDALPATTEVDTSGESTERTEHVTASQPLQKATMDVKTFTKKSSDSHTAPFSTPSLLTSLKSHSTRLPLALSIRKMSASVVASIAYTFDTVSGWSIGVQDLNIRPSGVVTSRIASTVPITTRRTNGSSPPSSPPSGSRSPTSTSEKDNQFEDGPTRLCYSHPYLLATLPDNTLVLHLCTSTDTSLSISPAMRLWGHTSGISDADITPRGKAVSVSTRGNEIRLWELEGRVGGTSVELKPRQQSHRQAQGADENEALLSNSSTSESTPTRSDLESKRSWVGFDDEMVIVLKEAHDGRDHLEVYDFTT